MSLNVKAHLHLKGDVNNLWEASYNPEACLVTLSLHLDDGAILRMDYLKKENKKEGREGTQMSKWTWHQVMMTVQYNQRPLTLNTHALASLYFVLSSQTWQMLAF